MSCQLFLWSVFPPFTPPSYLYVTNEGSNSVSAFSIESGGALTEIGSPVSTSEPWAVAVSPNGTYLYVTNEGSNSVSAFSIESGGALTPVTGSLATSSYPTGSEPYGVAIVTE